VNKSRYAEELIAAGKELYRRGLVTTRGGNLSVREGDRFLVTRTGSNLGGLSEADLIEVETEETAPISPAASCESPVHRAIYNLTEELAIVHAHGVNAIALAELMNGDSIRPIHNEALVGLKWIPVVQTSVPGEESGEEPEAIAAALTKWCSVVVRGHGAFTVGKSLEQALYKMLLLEDTCHISVLVQDQKRAAAPRTIGVLKTRERVERRQMVKSD